MIAMVLVASVRGLGQGKQKVTRDEEAESARRWGNKLFIPALTIPILTVLGTFGLKRIELGGTPVVDVKQVTVISLAIAGVGTVVSELAGRWLPLGTPFAAVTTYAIGMAVFTMIMGNAFAAFPVMTAGIGLPLVVQRFGGDPTIMSAIGMLSGFCGTLMTPMAANFNIVPV